MKKNVCVGPVSAMTYSTLLFVDCLTEYEIVSAWLPNGYRKQFQIFEDSHIYEKYSLLLQTDMVAALTKADILLIPEYGIGHPLYCRCEELIEQAVRMRKDIILLTELDKKKVAYYRELSQKTGVSFQAVRKNRLPNVSGMDLAKPLYKLKTPVIFIGELTGDLGSEELMGSIWKIFQNNHKRVSLVGKENILSLNGMGNVDFERIQGDSKRHVYRINRLFQSIEAREHPHAIICKLPNSMMKFNDEINADFGVSAFVISQAIDPSYFVLCAPAGYDGGDFWLSFMKHLGEKFGYRPDAIFVANKKVDWADLQNRAEIRYTYHSADVSKANLSHLFRQEDMEVLVGSLSEMDAVKNLYEDIMENTANASVMVL